MPQLHDFQSVFVVLGIFLAFLVAIHVDFLSYEQVQASQQSPVIIHKEVKRQWFNRKLLNPTFLAGSFVHFFP